MLSANNFGAVEYSLLISDYDCVMHNEIGLTKREKREKAFRSAAYKVELKKALNSRNSKLLHTSCFNTILRLYVVEFQSIFCHKIEPKITYKN